MDDVMFSSSSDEWATPQPLFDQINEVFGPFDLDPCATAENFKAPTWMDVQINGLSREWSVWWGDPSGARTPANVFVNPPFCRHAGPNSPLRQTGGRIEPWIKKAWDEVQLGNASQVVMLIPARTETRIWHDVIFKHADIIAFVKGRIQFDGKTKSGKPASATFPSAIVVFRRHSHDVEALCIPPYITTWEQR